MAFINGDSFIWNSVLVSNNFNFKYLCFQLKIMWNWLWFNPFLDETLLTLRFLLFRHIMKKAFKAEIDQDDW